MMLTEATCSFVLNDTTSQFIRSWCHRVSSLAPHNMQGASSKITSLRWEYPLREQCPIRNQRDTLLAETPTNLWSCCGKVP